MRKAFAVVYRLFDIFIFQNFFQQFERAAVFKSLVEKRLPGKKRGAVFFVSRKKYPAFKGDAHAPRRLYLFQVCAERAFAVYALHFIAVSARLVLLDFNGKAVRDFQKSVFKQLFAHAFVKGYFQFRPVHIKRQGYVALYRGESVGHIRAVLALFQPFFQLALQLAQVGIHAVQVGVFRKQHFRRLFAHARNARNVVGSVAHKRFQVYHLRRGQTVLFKPFGGVFLHLAHALFRQKHMHAVGHELKAVPVARDDDCGIFPLPRYGADYVVRFKAVHLRNGNFHRAEYVFERFELFGKLFRHGFALRLVAFVKRLSEHGRLAVENSYGVRGLILVYHVDKHIHIAENRARMQPRRSVREVGQRVIRAVDKRIAVK